VQYDKCSCRYCWIVVAKYNADSCVADQCVVKVNILTPKLLRLSPIITSAVKVASASSCLMLINFIRRTNTILFFAKKLPATQACIVAGLTSYKHFEISSLFTSNAKKPSVIFKPPSDSSTMRIPVGTQKYHVSPFRRILTSRGNVAAHVMNCMARAISEFRIRHHRS
jgi:hypothetical protein